MLFNILNNENILIQEGLIGFLLGMLIVFLGIGILVFVVWFVGKAIKANPSEKKTVEELPIEPKVEEVVPVSDDIPDHIKVAIMAAVMAYFEQQNEKCEFTVRKIVRRR